MTGRTRHECERCGKEFFKRYVRDSHQRHCGRSSPFEGADTCPMCGQPYDSYTDHLAEECEPD